MAQTGKKADTKRTIPKAEYEKKRAEADKASAKFRAEIRKKSGAAALAGKEVDHKTPIAKGGSPTSKKNMELIPKKENRKKGAK